jgi:hypothetical protein
MESEFNRPTELRFTGTRSMITARTGSILAILATIPFATIALLPTQAEGYSLMVGTTIRFNPTPMNLME